MTTLKKALSLLQFLPLFLFMYSLVIFLSWDMAFKVSGIAAVAVPLAFFFAQIPMDNFMLGASLFLAGGAAIFYAPLPYIEMLYALYMEAMLFVSVFVVGLVMTFSSKTGFAGVVGEPARVRRASIYLLIGVAIAIVMAVFMRGDVINGFMLPWFMLLALRYMVR